MVLHLHLPTLLLHFDLYLLRLLFTFAIVIHSVDTIPVVPLNVTVHLTALIPVTLLP